MPLNCRTCFQLDDAYVLELVVNSKCSRADRPCEGCRVFLLHDREMPLKIAYEAIRKAIRLVAKQKVGSLGVVLRGGDLACSMDLILNILNFLRNESGVQVHVLLDGFCGLGGDSAMKQLKNADVTIYSNWTHELIEEQVIPGEKLASKKSIGRLYVNSKGVGSLSDDVCRLQRLGFDEIEVCFVDYRQWIKDLRQKEIVARQVKECMSLTNTGSCRINIFGDEMNDTRFIEKEKQSCPAGDSLECVYMDGTTYPCSRLSPLFALRGTVDDVVSLLERSFIERNGEACHKCKMKAFCADCPGDYMDEVLCSADGVSSFSLDHCYLARLKMCASFSCGVDSLGRKGVHDDPVLIKNLNMLKGVICKE